MKAIINNKRRNIMSRVLKTGINQISNSYAKHTGWSKGVDRETLNRKRGN